MKKTCKRMNNVYGSFVADEKIRLARRLITFEPCPKYVRIYGLNWTPCNGLLKKPVSDQVPSNQRTDTRTNGYTSVSVPICQSRNFLTSSRTSGRKYTSRYLYKVGFRLSLLLTLRPRVHTIYLCACDHERLHCNSETAAPKPSPHRLFT